MSCQGGVFTFSASLAFFKSLKIYCDYIGSKGFFLTVDTLLLSQRQTHLTET